MRVTEGLRGVSVSLTIALSALFLLNGCSTLSRQLNSLKELHGQRKFADMVESEENCEEERPECAQINLLLADAHLQLGHISQASIDADSALRLPEKDRRPHILYADEIQSFIYGVNFPTILGAALNAV